MMSHEEELEEWLSHYGVSGMKWGVRRNPESLSDGTLQRKSAAASKKATKLSGNKRLLEGLISRQTGYERLEKKVQKKDPNFKIHKLSEKEALAFKEKGFAKERRRTVALGAAQTAVMLGGAVGLAKVSGLTPANTARGVAMVGLFAARPVASYAISQNVAKRYIKAETKSENLKREIERRKS